MLDGSWRLAKSGRVRYVVSVQESAGAGPYRGRGAPPKKGDVEDSLGKVAGVKRLAALPTDKNTVLVVFSHFNDQCLYAYEYIPDKPSRPYPITSPFIPPSDAREPEWNNKSTEVSIVAGQRFGIVSKWITYFISATRSEYRYITPMLNTNGSTV